jgi:hypothetical protein
MFGYDHWLLSNTLTGIYRQDVQLAFPNRLKKPIVWFAVIACFLYDFAISANITEAPVVIHA